MTWCTRSEAANYHGLTQHAYRHTIHAGLHLCRVPVHKMLHRIIEYVVSSRVAFVVDVDVSAFPVVVVRCYPSVREPAVNGTCLLYTSDAADE